MDEYRINLANDESAAESLSLEFERDSRRYDRAFFEEDEG